MSILQYFERRNGLPDPRGTLSKSLPPRAIALANSEIEKTVHAASQPKRRGSYTRYSPQQRAEIGQHACRNGIAATSRMFSRKLGLKLSTSTVLKGTKEDNE